MRAVRAGNEIRVYDGYLMRESIKAIPGRRYEEQDKCWVVPFTENNVQRLAMLGATLDEELLPKYQEQMAENPEPVLPMPIKAKPYKHQILAFNFALKVFGVCNKAAFS